MSALLCVRADVVEMFGGRLRPSRYGAAVSLGTVLGLIVSVQALVATVIIGLLHRLSRSISLSGAMIWQEDRCERQEKKGREDYSEVMQLSFTSTNTATPT